MVGTHMCRRNLDNGVTQRLCSPWWGAVKGSAVSREAVAHLLPFSHDVLVHSRLVVRSAQHDLRSTR